MTRAYCTRCGAERDAAAGHCPVGHRVAVDSPGYIGRHRARVMVPRLQVLEVLGFSDHGTSTVSVAPTRPASRPRIPSTPRRSSRPIGRHRHGAPSSPLRTTEMTDFSLTTVDTNPTENTGVLVERLWEASTDTMADVERWHGAPPALEADPERRRWPWIMAVLSVAAVVVALWTLPTAIRERQAATLDDIGTAVESASADLAEARPVAATILDPGADTAQLSGMAVDLTRIDSAARDLLDQAVAAEEAALDSADEIGQAGELALSLERRLSTVLTYRLLLDSSLMLPDMPASVSPEELGDVARRLSEAITSIRSDVASLPRDEILDTHRSSTLESIAMLEEDQADYLAALRDGDADAARIRAANMRDRLAAIHEDLDEILASLSPWVQETIDAIDRNLAGA